MIKLNARQRRRAEIALQVTRGATITTAIGAGLSPPLTVVSSIVMLLAFACLPDAWQRLSAVLRQPLGRGWLALVAALLIALAVGVFMQASWRPSSAMLLGSWRHLLLVPVALAVFDDAAAKRRFALSFIAFAAVGAVASWIAVQVGYSRNAEFAGVVLRNTVTQALVFGVGLYLAVFLLLTQQVQARGARWLLMAVSALLLLQLLWLQTGRSGVLAVGVAAIVAILLQLKGRARWASLASAPLLAAALITASPTLQQRYALGLQELQHASNLPEYSSMGIRVVIWQTSVGLALERPLLGYGLAGFAPAYEARIKTLYQQGWKALPTADPHNQYLFLWLEAGVLGLLGFSWFVIGACRQPAAQPWRAIGVGLLAAWCSTSLFSSHFQAFNEGHLIAIFVGVFLARKSEHP